MRLTLAAIRISGRAWSCARSGTFTKRSLSCWCRSDTRPARDTLNAQKQRRGCDDRPSHSHGIALLVTLAA